MQNGASYDDNTQLLTCGYENKKNKNIERDMMTTLNCLPVEKTTNITITLFHIIFFLLFEFITAFY